MGRLFSCGIKITSKPDPSTLRPAGLGSLAGLQCCVTHPFFVEPHQLVTSVRDPHSNVSSSPPGTLTLDDVDSTCQVKNPNGLRSASVDFSNEAETTADPNAFTPTQESEDSAAHTTDARRLVLAGHTSQVEDGVLHRSFPDVAQPLSEMCLCLEPDAHEQPPVTPPRPSRGVGSAAFRDRHIGHQHLLQHVSGPHSSSSSEEFSGCDKRVGIRTQYYPHDTHSRIFATEPFTGKIRVRGELAMKLYMRNFSACPEEETEPIKQKKRHVRPPDHHNILNRAFTSQEDSGKNTAFGQVSSNSGACSTNVNKFQTDFFTWRTPLSPAEPRDRYSIRLVTQPPGAGDLLSWTTPWKDRGNAMSSVVACNTPVKDGKDIVDDSDSLNPWAALASSKLPSRIASARKLADYTGNGIFYTPSDANTPRPDFTSLRKALAAEERAIPATPALGARVKPRASSAEKHTPALDFRERGFR